MTEETAGPIVEVDLGDNGGRRLYRNVEELEAWFTSENAFWDWLRQTNWDAARLGRSMRQLRQLGLETSLAKRSSEIQLAALGRIGAAIKASSTQAEKASSTGDSLTALLREIYAAPSGDAPKAIHSCSPAGKAIDELRQKEPALGACALAYFLKQKFDFTTSDDIEAICRAVLYEQGMAGTATAEKNALEQLFSEWTAELSTAKKNLAASQTDMSLFHSEEQSRATQRKIEFDKFMAESQAELSQLVVASKKELADIERTYNEKLALQASVSYWGEKAKKHTTHARVFALASGGTFVVGGVALFVTLELLIGDAKLSDVQMWKLGLLLILATVVVWAIRVLIRLLMSNLHLHDDAEERTTMLLTYLALLREGQLPENVRQLILQALFRPAATGIVRDDAAPPFMAQWLKLTTGSEV